MKADRKETVREATEGARKRAIAALDSREVLENRAAERPIVKELAQLGYRIESLADLPSQGKTWKSAIPILLEWLTKTDNLDVKNAIVGCLSVPWLRGAGTALLIEQFKKYAVIPDPPGSWIELSEKEKQERSSALLAWTIGNALSVVDIRGFEGEIIDLCRNTAFGTARRMIVVRLAKLKDLNAEETALDLLDDKDVRPHAVTALGKMKSRRALRRLEELLADNSSLVRREARRAIKNIAK